MTIFATRFFKIFRVDSLLCSVSYHSTRSGCSRMRSSSSVWRSAQQAKSIDEKNVFPHFSKPVIVDNISDLLPSINDGEASVEVIDQLMQLASEYNCNISVVIHLNRSGEKRNLRGWLGTELLHKSFEVFYCERVYNTKIFSVEQTLTRKQDIDLTLYYSLDDEGLPKTVKKPNIQPRDEQGKFLTNKAEAYQVSSEKVATFNQQYIIRHDDDARKPWEWDLTRLFADAIDSRASVDRDDLRRAVMEKANILQPKYYEKILSMALEQRVVKTTMDRNGRIVVVMT